MNKTFGFLLIILVLIAGATYAFWAPHDASANVKSVVTDFGTQLQKVSLLAPDASSTMMSAYGPYVSSDLLASWQREPERAPGRLTSSPWPDHVEIASAEKQDDGTYLVSGTVIERTSTGVNGSYPVSATLAKIEGSWKITAFSGYPPTSTSSTGSASATSSPPNGTPITVTGKIVCLPHKDTSGPQTLECALGIQDESGTYYALSDERGPAGIGSIGNGTRVEVIGTFMAHSASNYQDIGVISVKTATLVSS